PRIATALTDHDFDIAVFEYWHAVGSIPAFHAKGVRCVLDMHDVLWQSYSRQLSAKTRLPAWWKGRSVAQYKTREEAAWQCFDALIAINAAEMDYAQEVIGSGKTIFYAPMGTDLEVWPYCYD